MTIYKLNYKIFESRERNTPPAPLKRQVSHFIYFFLFFTSVSFASSAQLTSLPTSDSTFYGVDPGIKKADHCSYLLLEHDTLRTLPDNFVVLKQLRGITFKFCARANWAQVFKVLAQMPRLEYVEIMTSNISKLNENIKLLKQIKSLNLKTNKLTSLPDEIKEMRSLRYLDISFNYSLDWDQAFDKLAEYKQLEALNLSSCNLVSIPAKISDLSFLHKLYISHNYFASLPASFSSLQLEYLDLSDNLQLIWANSFVQVAAIQSLRELIISNNQLTALPDKIGGLKNLERLDASGNELTGLPESIGGLTNLKELNIGTGKTMFSHSQIEKFPSSLSKLINLEVLNMNGTYMEELPSGIDKMVKLRELLINWCGLTSLKNLENCTQLRTISASHNYFDKLPDWIGNLTQLKVLELDGNFFPNKAVPHLNYLPVSICNLAELEVLSLNDQLLKEMPADIGKMKKLRILNLRNNQLATMPASFTQCTALEELDLKANMFASFPDFNSFTNLKKLDISFNDFIELDKESGKFSKLSGLKQLDISYLKASDNTLAAIKTSLPNTDIIYKTYKDLKFNPADKDKK